MLRDGKSVTMPDVGAVRMAGKIAAMTAGAATRKSPGTTLGMSSPVSACLKSWQDSTGTVSWKAASCSGYGPTTGGRQRRRTSSASARAEKPANYA